MLPMLIKALLATRKPLLCAVIYGLALLSNDAIFSLSLGAQPQRVFAIIVLNTLAAWVYFYLLKESDDSSLYWVILGLGAGLLIFATPS